LGDRPGAAEEGMTEHEFRQRMREHLDHINERLDRIDERLDRLER
jgi:RNA polymerase-binding transcription factor DksA